MSLSDLASIGTFLSALGVLISLIYLSAQVRQATKHQRAQMLESRTTRVVDWQMRLTDPGVAPVWSKVVTGSHNFTPVEAAQATAILRALFVTAEATYLQFRNGLIEDRAFVSMRNNWIAIFAWPATRVLWRQFRGIFDPSFVALMDEAFETGASSDRLAMTASELNSAIEADLARSVARQKGGDKPPLPKGAAE
jgi:hypothetical protein